MNNTTRNAIKKQVWYHETMVMFHLGSDSENIKHHKESASKLREQYKVTEQWHILNASFRGE